MLSGVTVETEKSCIRDQKARVQLQFRPTSTLSSHVSIAFVALSRKFHRVIDGAAELSFYPLSPALIIFFSSFLFNHGGGRGKEEEEEEAVKEGKTNTKGSKTKKNPPEEGQQN